YMKYHRQELRWNGLASSFLTFNVSEEEPGSSHARPSLHRLLKEARVPSSLPNGVEGNYQERLCYAFNLLPPQKIDRFLNDSDFVEYLIVPDKSKYALFMGTHHLEPGWKLWDGKQARDSSMSELEEEFRNF